MVPGRPLSDPSVDAVNGYIVALDKGRQGGGRLVISNGHLEFRPLKWHEKARALLGFGPAAFRNVISYVNDKLELNADVKYGLIKKAMTYNETHWAIKRVSYNAFRKGLQGDLGTLIYGLFNDKKNEQTNVESILSHIECIKSEGLSSLPGNVGNPLRDVLNLIMMVGKQSDAAKVSLEDLQRIALALIEKMSPDDSEAVKECKGQCLRIYYELPEDKRDILTPIAKKLGVDLNPS